MTRALPRRRADRIDEFRLFGHGALLTNAQPYVSVPVCSPEINELLRGCVKVETTPVPTASP